MTTYFDRIMYLYPGIQNVVYWQTQYDGTPWKNPYDGIVWENTEIEKPSQKILDDLDEKTVVDELAKRAETLRKSERDSAGKNNMALVAAYQQYKIANPTITFSEYLDYLETIDIA